MILSKHAPHVRDSIDIEQVLFIEDITIPYSISFSTQANKDAFYKIIPSDEESIYAYLREALHHFTRFDLDTLLSHITNELVIKGESFLVLEEDTKDGTLQRWHLRTVPWQSYRSNRNVLTIKQGNSEFSRTETFEKKKVLRFSLKDIGFSGSVLRKAMSRIQRTSLVSRVSPEFFTNKSYDYFQHSKTCDLEFLSATKHIYWNGRSYNNQYTSEPYFLYKRGKWLQLRLMILDYLISRINDFIKDYGRQYDLSGEIQYHACFSKEKLNSLLDQYAIGKVTTAELRDYLLQY